MANNKDPYKILGIPRNANPEEIRKAYHQLARQTDIPGHKDEAKSGP